MITARLEDPEGYSGPIVRPAEANARGNRKHACSDSLSRAYGRAQSASSEDTSNEEDSDFPRRADSPIGIQQFGPKIVALDQRRGYYRPAATSEGDRDR